MTAGGGAQGPDGLRVVTGILAFVILLDALVGLGGRYDLTIGALATTLALWWIHRRGQTTVPVEPSRHHVGQCSALLSTAVHGGAGYSVNPHGLIIQPGSTG
ncbi:MAG TPA: hypothetical protein VLJ59_02165 [Mycobacteriales bacterium]|nr:hypothetical protein [Mycobacteriales bacterium]